MNTFNIYKHPAKAFEAVKIGFSWPALFFYIIWMLVKKLWGFAALWFVLTLILNIFNAHLNALYDNQFVYMEGNHYVRDYLLLIIGYCVLLLIPAFKGNSWRSENLQKRGYDLIKTIQAETPEAAIAQVMKIHKTQTNPQSQV